MALDGSNNGISEDEKCLCVQTHARSEFALHRPTYQSIGNDAYGGTRSEGPMRRSAEMCCQDMPSPQHQHERRVQKYVVTVYLEN